jgi:predicted phosphodiesterase
MKRQEYLGASFMECEPTTRERSYPGGSLKAEGLGDGRRPDRRSSRANSNGLPRRISRRVLLRGGAGLVTGACVLSLSCSSHSGDPHFSRGHPLRFGIVADCHYADADNLNARFYRESLGKLSECVARMNAERVDFLIELGDLKDQNNPPDENRTLEYLQSIEAVFCEFAGPRYHVLGNHDLDSISKQQFLAHIENTGIDPARSYYSFDVRGMHFLVLDANYTVAGRDYDHGNFDWQDAHVPAQEIDWLRQDLAACSGRVVVFIHQRLDGTGPFCVKNAAEVRKVLEASGKVSAVFQGHHHEGGYSRLGGIHYYTLPALVEGHGPDNNSWVIVEVDRDGSLTVTGYGRAPSMRLSCISGAPSSDGA